MRGLAFDAHLAADLQPASREHQVEHHQIGNATANSLERLRTVALSTTKPSCAKL